MKNKRDAEYAQALDRLEQKRASATITPGQYDLRRTKLLAEASRKPTSLGIVVLEVVGLLIVALIALRIIGALMNGLN